MSTQQYFPCFPSIFRLFSLLKVKKIYSTMHYLFKMFSTAKHYFLALTSTSTDHVNLKSGRTAHHPNLLHYLHGLLMKKKRKEVTTRLLFVSFQEKFTRGYYRNRKKKAGRFILTSFNFCTSN